MYAVLNAEELNRFYEVSKIYLKFLGEDEALADQVTGHKDVYASTVTDILNQLVLSSAAKLANAGHTDAAKELGQLLEKTANMGKKEKATFDMLLVGLEDFHKSNIVLI